MSSFTLKRDAFGVDVVGKLGSMRKDQEFTVRPRSDGTILVQSDKSIGVFNFRTGKGMLNTKGHYFTDLSPGSGVVAFEFPAEFVAACLEACPPLGSETKVGGVTFVNTVKVI